MASLLLLIFQSVSKWLCMFSILLCLFRLSHLLFLYSMPIQETRKGQISNTVLIHDLVTIF